MKGFFIALLCLLLTLGFFAFIGTLFFFPMPEGNKDTLLAAAGVLFGGANMAWGYYLGSTDSSKLKDSTIAEMSAKQDVPPPPKK